MATVSDGASGRSRRAQAVLSFASDLHKRLPTDKDDVAAADALLHEVQKQVHTVEKYSEKTNHGMLGDKDLDKEGTNIWNLCTRLSRENSGIASNSPPASSRLVLWGRVFAYQVLHLCQWSAESPPSVACHLTKLALKVAKCCIDDHDVHTARLVLQRAADYHGRLQDLSRTLEQDGTAKCTELKAEWTGMRIALAWQENQLDVAEHLFVQADDLLRRVRPASAEKIIDVLYQIGRGMLSREDFSMAEKWLQRAWNTINGQQLQDMSRHAVDLRMAILQALVTALMSIQTTDSIEKAHNLVKYIESEIGDQPVVLLLSLEILNKSPAEAFDGDAYGNILRRMIRSFRYTNSNFKLLLHHIRLLHNKSPGLGCSILDDFLAALVKNGQDSWIDQVVVTRVYMATSQRDFEETVDEAQKAISKLESPVSVDASFAAQTLIWKKIEANYNQGQFGMAEKWCGLALNPAFANSGPLNHAKLERKLLLCTIARNDLDTAKSVFFTMSQETQKDPMTQFLMYKAAVRSGDREMASKCLQAVAQANTKLELLYACVTESQCVGDRLVALEAMQKLADVYNLDCPGPVHLPALLRCIIIMLYGLLDGGEEVEKNSIVASLCDMFDGVVTAVPKAPKGKDGKRLFDVKELEWFCQNSYNLGLKHANDWDLRKVVQILTACVNIIRSFPGDIPEAMSGDLSLKSIFCNFLISSALVSLARSQDTLEQQLQDYLVMRKYVAAADYEIQMRLESLDEVASRDLLDKLALLLAFEFEAAVALKQWQDLGEIVLKANQCQNLESFKTMADCILRAHAPPEELFSVLRKIINEISALEDSDTARLAKYTRCLFQAILPFNENLADQLLDEACRMASEAHGTPGPWPTEELEWMASAAYNHSIDLYVRKENEACRWWAQKAMNIAHYCDDKGQLETILQDRYVKLKLDGEQGEV